jgi:hypothetical protein
MAKKTKKEDFNNAIKVLITPWERGFTCGIVMESKAKMTTEQYELCSTIARGMIKAATQDPQTIFVYGLKGFADDKRDPNKENLTINSVAEFDEEDNVIDFIEYLKLKREKELN